MFKPIMSRSIWKLPFSEIPFLSFHVSYPPVQGGKAQVAGNKAELQTKIWSRRSMVMPHFVGRNFLIYNGKLFIPLKVSENMIGHKFGEFATTRKKTIHKLSKKKQSTKK